MGHRWTQNGLWLRAASGGLQTAGLRRQDEDRIRLDSGLLPSASDPGDVDEDRLRSAKVLLLSVRGRDGEEEGRVLIAEAAGRQEEVLGRGEADPFSSLSGRRRFVASVSRLDRVVGPSARDLFPSAADPVLSAKALLLPPKAGFTSPKAGFASPKAGFSSTKAMLPPALESSARHVADFCPFNDASRDVPPRFPHRRVVFFRPLAASRPAERLGRTLEANTVKRRTHSLFDQGAYGYRAIPTMRDDWLRTPVNAFDRIVGEHAVFRDVFGVP